MSIRHRFPVREPSMDPHRAEQQRRGHDEAEQVLAQENAEGELRVGAVEPAEAEHCTGGGGYCHTLTSGVTR